MHLIVKSNKFFVNWGGGGGGGGEHTLLGSIQINPCMDT